MLLCFVRPPGRRSVVLNSRCGYRSALPKEMKMKRTIVRWSVLYLVSTAMLLPGLASSVSANTETQTFTDSSKIPLSFTFGDNCGMNGLISATGKAHLLVHTTVNDNGDVNVSMEYNYNLSGVAANGVKYTANEAFHLTQNTTLSMTP